MSNPPPAQYAEGTVRWFDPLTMRGVVVDESGTERFIPRYIAGVLFPGQRVAFLPQRGPRGDMAIAVRPIGDQITALADGVDSRAAAQTISHALGETQPGPWATILRVVEHLGSAAAWALIEEARQIEAAGGMLTYDGSRRRTLGGVFFALVTERVDDAARATIFPYQRRLAATSARVADLPPGAAIPPMAGAVLAPSATSIDTPPPPPTWADRLGLVSDLADGKATTVKVTLIGRPQDVRETQQFVVMRMVSANTFRSLPKGLPIPNQVPPTTYLVYIARKQWSRVVESLRDEGDALIVEGVQFLDLASQSITVFATNTTTKHVQAAARAAQRAQADGSPDMP